MPSVCTTAATMVGVDLAHGLTRMRWQTPTAGLPTAAEVTAALTAMMAFWTAIEPNVVAGVAIDPEDVAIVQDEATGLTTAAVAAASLPAGVVGTDSSAEHVSGTGGRVTWRTGIRRGSREVRGATFIIPMGAGQFTSGGNLTSGCIAGVAGAANTYLGDMATAGLVPVVYGRPLPATTHHGALAGLAAPITIADMSAVPAFLRRRRS